MVSENAKKNAGYLQILLMLNTLRDRGIITVEEHEKAQAYYTKLTGADIVLAGAKVF